MLNAIRNLVDRLVNDPRLSALEKRALDKYEELTIPKGVSKCTTGCVKSDDVGRTEQTV
jgi:hypothetical protein